MTLHLGVETHDQRTDDWHEARLGKITASKIHDIIAKTAKGLYTSKRDDYAYQLAAERLTSQATRFYTNDAMLWGQETEPLALEFYAAYFGYDVQPAPFVLHPEYEFCGCSPDGIVNGEWLVEIKCCQTNTFLRIKHDKVAPPQYVAQCQMQMFVTGAPKVDLFFYDPRIADPSKQFFMFEIQRDEEYILNLEHEIVLFNDLVRSITQE